MFRKISNLVNVNAFNKLNHPKTNLRFVSKFCTTSTLRAISPYDGRYAKQCDPLRDYFSEFALMKYRVLVEIHWFQCLFQKKIVTSETNDLDKIVDNESQFLNSLFDNFNLDHGKRIKEFEKITNHDVKAVEYFLKEQIGKNKNLENLTEFVHFSCTSEDINNLSYALMLQNALKNVIFPKIEELLSVLKKLSLKHADTPMMCRTHGQSATPSTVGKEIANFAYRVENQLKLCKTIELTGKFNGATGNLNAHVCAYPEKDWLKISEEFVEGLGVKWNPYTTQIEPHDSLANICVLLSVLNIQLTDFSRDMWGYIMLGYFKQKAVEGEIGSSTMPHKINPIDFENAEGNFSVANSLLVGFSQKLPSSRFQRDLSDSTVLRNLGLAFSGCLQSYQSLLKGLNRVDVNEDALNTELDSHYELLAEPVQTIMRRYGCENPYEQMKEFTRGKTVTQEDFIKFITNTDLPEKEKQKLLNLKPHNYLGLAPSLAKNVTGNLEQLK